MFFGEVFRALSFDFFECLLSAGDLIFECQGLILGLIFLSVRDLFFECQGLNFGTCFLSVSECQGLVF